MFRRTVYATSAGAAFLLVGTLVWNVWQHFHDNGTTVGAGLRRALHI